MYTLITADDEEIARRSLELLIISSLDNVQLVASAENGSELICSVEQYNPDIAIVDINMPGINGLDAIRYLQERGCKTKFILLTAYSDYKYLQQAIDLKVASFVLKSDKSTKIIEAVKNSLVDLKRMKLIQNNIEYINEINTKMLPILEEEIMFSIFLNKPSLDTFNMYCKLNNFKEYKLCMISYIPTKNYIQKLESLIKTSLTNNSVKSLISSNCNCISSISNISGALLLLIPKGFDEEYVKKVLSIFYHKFLNLFEIDLMIGMGSIVDDFSQITKSYQDGLFELQQASKPGVFYNNSNLAQEDKNEIKKIAFKLLQCITSGNSLQLKELIDYFDRNKKLIDNKILYKNICELLMSSRKITTSQYILFLQYRKNIENDTSSKMLKNILLKIQDKLRNDSKDENNPYVEKALIYVKSHAFEDISLNVVADKIGISPFYFSRLIKKSLGITFIDLLTNIRMEKAKELALDNRYQVNEIALSTGYKNTAYFCKVFKSYHGYSIGEFRRNKK